MTAVEWLENSLPSLFIDDSGHYKELFQQAKKMEKQQLHNEYERGFLKCADTLQFILDKGLMNNYKTDEI
jgi:hypothetical protein